MNITKPMKTIVSIAAVCAVLAFTGMSNANVSSEDNVETKSHKHYQKSERHHRGKDMMKKMSKYLGLSEEQKTQMKAIKTAAKEQDVSLRAEIKQFKEAEKLLLQAEKFDEQTYIALHDSYKETFAQMALAKAKTRNAMFNVLTPEQQVKWESKMEQRKSKMQRKGKNKKAKSEDVSES
ncbi:Spy/CpxP family protein refolding chaperone [Colwellia sp. 4_MG-2023]|uniref:Spy/CpxP family protein refolding chaperone n=1 Tax=unclassified Colwellia TaxID=196834 RepID=UPI0026E278AE|nr:MULTISPECIES: Spy/CpxP family protein refolding chaperone [unclassified Colwellia]MDO6507422.1 Spy/CpxP family protein refolding chaperone [Colwellia sp. 5_MG-2023]MDO6556158.1 Spy/CpxP family protein refolding chaperone [Colwellia sp. 4_MG-2023]